MEPTTEWLSVTEAAALKGVSRARVYQMIHAGRLPASRFGKLTMIRPADLERWDYQKVGRKKKEAPGADQ